MSYNMFSHIFLVLLGFYPSPAVSFFRRIVMFQHFGVDKENNLFGNVRNMVARTLQFAENAG